MKSAHCFVARAFTRRNSPIGVAPAIRVSPHPPCGKAAALNRKRGRKPDPDADLRYELEKMRKENERLKKRLDKAETIIDVQKKLCTALGLDPKT